MTTSLDLAKAFAKIMDSGNYEPAHHYLTNDCRYEVGEAVYCGPNEILETYKSHHDFAKTSFDSVVYASEVLQISDKVFEVIYIDIITHGKRTHTYKCKQFIYLNSENKIYKITHEDIAGETERIKEFYKEVGLR